MKRGLCSPNYPEMRQPPYYINYSRPRLFTHNIITSKYFDLAIAAVIGLNVVTMAMEFYMMPYKLEYTLKIFNYFFTAVFIVEAFMKVFALGLVKYLKNRWNQLDMMIVGLSIAGIILEKMESDLIPINPTIIRVMRVLRIARVLKLLKMAKGIRALLDTVMQALPQVGNLGLLFFLLFFIFAALGVELFGRLECSENLPCEGLGEHAHFKDFGMAFLTLFRVATGDNWNGIMKDTLRDICDYSSDCIQNCCISPIIAPLYFVVFVLMAQFVLVNVVVAVLMKHLEESNKQMDDDIEMDAELEREYAAEMQQRKLVELGQGEKRAIEVSERRSYKHRKTKRLTHSVHRPLKKMASLPPNFVFSFNNGGDHANYGTSLNSCSARNAVDCVYEDQEVLATAVSLSQVSGSSSSPQTKVMPDINIRQASPDEAESKVSVANLSPVPLRGSFGPTLSVPKCSSAKSSILTINTCSELESNQHCKYEGKNNSFEMKKDIQKPDIQVNNQQHCDWTCVFVPTSSDPYKVHLLPFSHDVHVEKQTTSSEIPSLEIQNRDTLSKDQVKRDNSNKVAILDTFSPAKTDNSFIFESLTDSDDISSSPVLSECVLRKKNYDSSECETSCSSPSLFSSDCYHNEVTPLIVRCFQKRLLGTAGESSISSQSDVPDENKDKSAATDSTSLEC